MSSLHFNTPTGGAQGPPTQSTHVYTHSDPDGTHPDPAALMARLIRGQEISPEERAALDAGWLDLAAVLEATPVRDREVALIQSDAPARPGQIDAAKTAKRMRCWRSCETGRKPIEPTGQPRPPPGDRPPRRSPPGPGSAWSIATDAFGQYRPLDQRNGQGNAFIQKAELTPATLRRHFAGEDQGDLIGLFSTTPARPGRGRQHRDEPLGRHRHRPARRRGDAEANERYALRSGRAGQGLRAAAARQQRIGRFPPPHPVRRSQTDRRRLRLPQWLLRDWQDHGLAKEPETFPKQPR